MLACVLLVTFYSNFSCLLGLNQSKIKACCDINHVLYLTDVTVKNVLLQSVTQKTAKTIEAVISGKTADLKATDFKIVNKSNNNVIAVKAVSVDKTDATKVTIETFADMRDAATYVVEVEGGTAEFVATDGVVADLNVTPVQIPANTTGTEIKGQTLDKNGVILDEFNATNYGNVKNVEFKLSTTQGYVNAEKLVLPVVGNKGIAEITYHTYKYDDKAQEIGALTKKVDIVAIEDTPATVDGFKYTLGTTVPADWSKVTVNNQFSVSDGNVKAYFNFVDSKKTDVTTQYTVVSSDDSVLLLSEQTASGTGINVIGVKAGSAYINVKKDGKVVTSLPVIVTEARKLANITLDTTAVTISNCANMTETVNVKAVDQYGKDITLSGLTASVLNTNTSGLGLDGSSKTKIDITATTATVGSYTVKVEAAVGNDKIARTVTVNVVATTATADTATDLRLVISASEVDMAVADDATATTAVKNVTAEVVAYEKGAKVGVVSGASFTLNDSVTGITSNGKKATVDVVTVASGKATKVLEANKTYVIKATVGAKTFAGSFTVKDSQSSASATISKKETTVVPASTTPTVDEVQSILRECVVISYNGNEYKTTGITVTKADGAKNNGNSTYIGTVMVTVSNGTVSYDVPVAINTTFTK